MTGLQSILAFGALLPPQAPWSDAGDESNASYTAAVESAATTVARVRDTVTAPLSETSDVVDRLDAQLEAMLSDGRRPVVLFSGGVDSGVLAARLKQLGRSDTLLVNYRFSSSDPESYVAVEMARQLDLPLEIVSRDGNGLRVLEEPGQTYPVPFGDHSTVPTRELCLALPALVAAEEVVILDGTGADGAFGLGHKARPLLALGRLPGVAVAVPDLAYVHGGWRLNDTVEYRLRQLRRARHLSPGGALIAQNALFGILYDAPDLTRIDHEWQLIVQRVAPDDPIGQIVVTDLAITCASIFAQKSWGPLTSNGFEARYPFLSLELGGLGVASTARFTEAMPKQWMRNELTKHVSRDLVERPKSGFIEPAMSLFDTPEFEDALHDAVSTRGTAHPLIRQREMRTLLRRKDRLGALPHGHLNLLWALAFTDRWYRTVARES